MEFIIGLVVGVLVGYIGRNVITALLDRLLGRV